MSKNKCNKCKYHGSIAVSVNKNSGKKGRMVTCDYILITGRMRPCPASDCTVYERGTRKKGKDTLNDGVIF